MACIFGSALLLAGLTRTLGDGNNPDTHLLSCFSNTVTVVSVELSQSFRSVSQSFQSFCHSRFRHTVTEVPVTGPSHSRYVPIRAELPSSCC